MAARKVRYLRVSWDDVARLVRRVAREVVDEGWRPEAIVAISRGGLFHGRVLSDLLGIPALYAVKVEHWGVTATITGEARVAAPLSGPVEGKRVLAVDDIADTGDSLALVRKHLEERGAGETRLATLHYLPSSKVRPDFYGKTLQSWVWVVYPWNFTEDLGNVARKMLPEEGLGAAELRRKLAARGFASGAKEFADALALLKWQGKLAQKGGRWRAGP
ncbi:MAG: phosphoribosyltransferase [Halobacteria archaeon]